MVKDLIFLVVALFFLLFFPLNFSFAGEKEGARRTVTNQFLMGDLELTTVRNPLSGEYCLQFAQSGKVLFTSSCAFQVHEPKIVTDVPGPGCRSLSAYCFSGGAHCCMTLVIATECDRHKSLNAVDLAHSAGAVKFIHADDGKNRQIKITDWRFAYYGPEDSAVQLSFAASPGMTRLLVFDDGNWRVDKTEEFIPFYSRLLRESMQAARMAATRNEDPEIMAAKAMKATYYSVLAGKPAEEQLGLLNQFLPPNWKPESEKILKDIRQAVLEFNPVDVIQ